MKRICIYDIYAETHQTYLESLHAALQALSRSSIPKDDWPVPVIELETNGQGPGGAGDLLDGMDPATKAFLELEGKLKKAKEIKKEGG